VRGIEEANKRDESKRGQHQYTHTHKQSQTANSRRRDGRLLCLPSPFPQVPRSVAADACSSQDSVSRSVSSVGTVARKSRPDGRRVKLAGTTPAGSAGTGGMGGMGGTGMPAMPPYAPPDEPEPERYLLATTKPEDGLSCSRIGWGACWDTCTCA
jgi:hypothetical protein